MAHLEEPGQQGGADVAPDAARDRPRADPEELAEKLAMPLDKMRKFLEIAEQPIRLKTAIGEEEDPYPG